VNSRSSKAVGDSRPAASAPAWWKVCPVGTGLTAVGAGRTVVSVAGHQSSGSKAPGRQPQERGRFEWWNPDRHGDGHDNGDGGWHGHGQDGHDQGNHWGEDQGHGHGESHGDHGNHFGH
jgi:hypothetical protein